MPKSSVAISRNVDFDFGSPEHCEEQAYRISKRAFADPGLYQAVCEGLSASKLAKNQVYTGRVNASADSFYSSQGRQTSFPDHNEHLIDTLRASIPDLATLEMETFHLYHLASCWGSRRVVPNSEEPPLTRTPAQPVISQSTSPALAEASETSHRLVDASIKAAAVHMVFASRTSQEFITPQQVTVLENLSGQAVLDALSSFNVGLCCD